MHKFKKLNTLKPFDWLLILGVISANIIYSVLENDFDVVGSLAGITGVVCVVLVAKGNILNYFFGLVNVALYAYVSFKAQLYGDAALNALYYLPMQFVGWYSWINRRESVDSVTVEARRMSLMQRVWLGLFTVSTVSLTAWVLYLFRDPQPVKDAATTILSVIAMFLMVRRFMEQWVLWVVTNIISVVMWVVALANGEAHSALMIIMWVFYLANSLNGWVTWAKLSRSRQ
ncbi:MAG: nicotinamide riboside transporter PnuC [Bacteroidales bacterium]|nr:nicotinamide riboside transporter PnuC [Bacteroidales bacterium]MDD3300117.1 nicotinamide riboside transporter PnuC [Bacteroidales bacterium]MDD3843522.1 nicotinamide riboside transporter PnuC [Bacteroidales bacterium]MDD4617890.1 nicotinamide riboside transporter PnuC [Bacteroidales bacterium]